jgi:dCTP deaminase
MSEQPQPQQPGLGPGVLSAQSIKAVGPVWPIWKKYKLYGVSGGLSQCGYDICLKHSVQLIPVFRSFVVTAAAEYFTMPNNLVGIVHDKSTWARSGICVQNTVIEPGWRGTLMLELSLHVWRSFYLKAGTPIAQVIFHTLDQPTEIPYEGKYQDQKDGTQAIFEPEDPEVAAAILRGRKSKDYLRSSQTSGTRNPSIGDTPLRPGNDYGEAKIWTGELEERPRHD